MQCICGRCVDMQIWFCDVGQGVPGVVGHSAHSGTCMGIVIADTVIVNHLLTQFLTVSNTFHIVVYTVYSF